jgi:hypothetical protein
MGEREKRKAELEALLKQEEELKRRQEERRRARGAAILTRKPSALQILVTPPSSFTAAAAPVAAVGGVDAFGGPKGPCADEDQAKAQTSRLTASARRSMWRS